MLHFWLFLSEPNDVFYDMYYTVRYNIISLKISLRILLRISLRILLRILLRIPWKISFPGKVSKSLKLWKLFNFSAKVQQFKSSILCFSASVSNFGISPKFDTEAEKQTWLALQKTRCGTHWAFRILCTACQVYRTWGSAGFAVSQV